MSQTVTYRVDHQHDNGWPIIVRINLNGSETSQAPTADGSGPLRAEFDTWNADQVPPLAVSIVIPPPPPTPFADYARPFVNNVALWVRMHKALDDVRTTFVASGATAATILANNQDQVRAVVAVIATAPQGVIDALIQERVLEGSTTTEPLTDAKINAMAIGECRIIINMCQKAANKGIALAVAATMPID